MNVDGLSSLVSLLSLSLSHGFYTARGALSSKSAVFLHVRETDFSVSL